MRGLTGLALIMCLFVPFFGVYQFLSVHILRVKEEVKNLIEKGIESEKQVLLKFTQEDIHTQLAWEHSKEFKYKGEMYDIICSETRGDSTWYWCYWDKKETQLKKERQNLLAIALAQNPQQQNNQNHFFHYFKTLYPISPIHHSIKVNVAPGIKQNKAYFFSTTSFILRPPIPPPRFL